MLLLLPIAGCSTLSMSEYQNASSLGGGNVALTIGVPAGPSQSVLAATRLVEAGMISSIELGVGMGVGERNDIRAGVWSGMGVLSLISPGYDYGWKVNWKLMLTAIDAPHKFALSTTFLAYRGEVSDEIANVHYDIRTMGITPALIYSYHPNPTVAFHANLKYGYFGFVDTPNSYPYGRAPKEGISDMIVPSIGCLFDMGANLESFLGFSNTRADIRGYAEITTYVVRHSAMTRWNGISSAIGVVFLFGKGEE